MKLMFASDIHGSAYYCRKMKEAFEKEKADKLILLGDLLYHGPRNDLPQEYNPKEVISILNGMKEAILCVQGNCDAYVDQMVLEFSITAENLLLFLAEKTVFITHGHLTNRQNPPFLRKGDILMNGHTHIAAMDLHDGGFLYLNPGSVSLPKEGTKNSYMIFDNHTFILKELNGKEINRCDV